MRRYSRSYTYDLHGNITQIRHQAGLGGWTRRLSYGPASNRLLAASAPADAAGVFSLGFTHDAQGRMLTAPGLGAAEWSATGQMTALDMGGGGAARYYYGAGGGRVRKVVTRPGGLGPISRLFGRGGAEISVRFEEEAGAPRVPIQRTLDLRQLRPGNYTLEVTVEQGGERVRRRSPFQVVGPPSP